MDRIILVAATNEVKEILDLTLPKIEAFAKRCDASLKILSGLPNKYQHGKYRIFEAGEIDAERILLMDADMLPRDIAPNIFEMYPTGNWMFNEGRYRGHGFVSHRKEIDKYIRTAGLPQCKWPSQNWWNPGISLLSKEAAHAIFQMPPWNVNDKLYNVTNGMAVKNMPWVNYRIAITETEIKNIDVRWNTFPSMRLDAQQRAYVWHCFCNEIQANRTISKVRVIKQMCKRHGESLLPAHKPAIEMPERKYKYHVHFICGKQTKQWILGRMQQAIIKQAPHDVEITEGGEAIDEPRTINWYNPYRIYRKKSKYALDVAFCTHPEIESTWNQVIKEADHITCMCKQYYEQIAEQRENVSLIYPGVDPEYYNTKLRVFNPVMMTGSARKGFADWQMLMKLEWLDCHCSEGKLTRDQLLAYYLAADVILSTATMEGGPMSIFEAAALNKLCFAKKGVGLVDDFTFPNLRTYSNTIQLIEMLKELYYNKVKTGNWEFTWEKWAKEHWALFNDLEKQMKDYPNFKKKKQRKTIPVKRRFQRRR